MIDMILQRSCYGLDRARLAGFQTINARESSVMNHVPGPRASLPWKWFLHSQGNSGFQNPLPGTQSLHAKEIHSGLDWLRCWGILFYYCHCPFLCRFDSEKFSTH